MTKIVETYPTYAAMTAWASQDGTFLVTDATGDPSGATGQQKYVYDSATGVFSLIPQWSASISEVRLTATQGQSVFTLPFAPTDTDKAKLNINGQTLDHGDNRSITWTTLTRTGYKLWPTDTINLSLV